jgi:hypothetical protein
MGVAKNEKEAIRLLLILFVVLMLVMAFVYYFLTPQPDATNEIFILPGESVGVQI